MLIAQLSDLHVTAPGTLVLGSIDSNRALTIAVDHLNALNPRPDLLVITGDLTETGQPEQYRHLLQLLAPLTMPFRVIPGNHDQRAALRAVFAGHPALPVGTGDFLHYVEEGFAVRVIALDTVVPGRPHGELCEVRLGWLAKRLGEAPERPTVILQHHPPFAVGIEAMDGMRLLGGSRIEGALVGLRSNIARLLCGHVHRPITVGWHGTVGMVAPSPAHQLALNLSAGASPCWSREPPGVLLHYWRPDQDMISHLSIIGDFPATPF